MPPYRPSPQLLDRALSSLAAWHLLEALAGGPAGGLPLSAIVVGTGLDVAPLQAAAAALWRSGLLTRTAEGHLALAPHRAEAIRRLVDAAAADRLLYRSLVKEAARRELCPGPLTVVVRARRLSARSTRR